MKFNSLNKDKIKKLGSSVLITAAIGATAVGLSGCNKDLIDTNKTFDKAIVVGDGIVTIYEVKQYASYDTERYQLRLPDDTYMMTSTVTTKFISTKDSNIDIEEFAKTLVPENYEIRYVGQSELNNMKKVR